MDALVPQPVPLPLLVDTLEPLVLALDRLPPDLQRNWMRSLGSFQLRRLWWLAERHHAVLTVQDMVPADQQGVVVCPGKNHLPVFSWFEKRFARVGDQVVGYNETGWEKLWVGPGHFVLRSSDTHEGELIVDYRTLPRATHPDFPVLLDNQRLGGWPGPLARLVYGGLVDRLRRVSDHMVVGRSATEGFSLQAGAYFALWVP